MNNINFNNILQWIILGLIGLIGLAIFLIVIFLTRYTGNQVPRIYLLLAIAALVIIGYGLNKLHSYVERLSVIDLTKDDSLYSGWITKKIEVKDIDIRTAPYYKEVPKSSGWRIQGLDSFSNDNGVKREKVEMNYIIYKSGKKIYRQAIGNDSDVLRFRAYLAQRTHLDLHINRNEKSDYYFDLT
ncbi:hypothetical protein INQ51_22255 [Maribellus sp. CM-23]|uniref:hypothetical protein n=1 Tax=Maribellus sp. CM-23 TaxID=2781026 RepID=UPI001F315368|nr:hypothetical protein [Maribellus sp. CM-23]MCE4567061.1 hypothetical protein [Maribellus sp. CM-23]